jgi:MFS family permease
MLGLGNNVDASLAPTTLGAASQLPPFNFTLLLAAVLCFLFFLLVEARIKDPLLDLRLFRHPNLAAGALINLLVGFCLTIGLVSVPILVNVRLVDASQLNQGALQTGLLLSALTVPMALAAVPGGWLSDRIGYQKTTLLGLGLSIFGFGLIWQTWNIDLPDAVIALEMLFIGVGLGLTFSPISAAVINSADEDKRGVASALVIVLRLIGMTVAVASLTTLALQRVTTLAGAAIGVAAGGAVPDPMQFADIYARITVLVLAELGLVGAVVCAAAIIPALWGLGRTRGSSVPQETASSVRVTGD